jgi:hypothetical protein
MDKLIIAFTLQQSPLKKDTLEPDVYEMAKFLVGKEFFIDTGEFFKRTEKADRWLDSFFQELDKEFSNGED